MLSLGKMLLDFNLHIMKTAIKKECCNTAPDLFLISLTKSEPLHEKSTW